MANQLTPAVLLQRQLTDWNLLLAQFEANPDTTATELAYCKAKIEQLTQELADLNLQ